MSTHAPRLPDPSVARQRGRFTLLPSTRMGWAGLWCAILAPILTLVPNMLFGPGPGHPVSMISTALGFLSALASAVLAGVAWPKGERSLLLLIASTLLALFVVVFLVGEAFFEGRG